MDYHAKFVHSDGTIDVPVSIHADVVKKELWGMFTAMYREKSKDHRGIQNVFMDFVVGILATMVSEGNKEKYRKEGY